MVIHDMRNPVSSIIHGLAQAVDKLEMIEDCLDQDESPKDSLAASK